MAKKRNSGLGKGLDALFGEIETIENESPDDNDGSGVDSIDINDIKPNRDQPRKTFSEEGLEDLASSIKEHGVIQPIIVRPSGEGYEIVAGERRWRAARKAGLKTVPCLVRELSDRENMLFAIIENMQREDLNPIEEARGLSGMISEYGLTQEQVSASVGKSRPYIANSLRLLKLPEAIQEKAAEGTISAGHARALLQMKDEQKMTALAEKIEKEGLSVRETEAIASGKKKAGRRRGRPMEKNADVLRIEEDLKTALGTKVSLRFSGNKGKIEIECYSREEMDRIIELLREI
ncbi:MAG: ParB/RepB/Spo0J family partition protein [Anaerovoracaceae bacterium]|jgi:ParB family chromosome partitioning protein